MAPFNVHRDHNTRLRYLILVIVLVYVNSHNMSMSPVIVFFETHSAVYPKYDVKHMFKRLKYKNPLLFPVFDSPVDYSSCAATC